MSSMWQAAGAPAVASLCCKERGQKHLGYPREEIRAGLATGQVRNHQQTLASTMQVSAALNLSPQTSRRKGLLCAPLLGLGLVLSPASADARPNRVEGRGDARKELKEYRDRAMEGIEESIDGVEDAAEDFASQVQDFVEERKAVAAKELEESVEETVLKVSEVSESAESISFEEGVNKVKEAGSAAAEKVSEIVEEAAKSVDIPDTIQSGAKKIQAAVDKVPEVVSSVVEKVADAPALLAEKKDVIVEGAKSGVRAAGKASSDVVNAVSDKLSLEDGLKRIRELQGN